MRIELEAAEIKALAAEVAIHVNQTLLRRMDELEATLLKLLGEGVKQGGSKGQVIALEDRYLSTADVTAMLGISRSTLHRMVERGEFPEKIQVTPGRVGWKLSTVNAWIDKRQAA